MRSRALLFQAIVLAFLVAGSAAARCADPNIAVTSSSCSLVKSGGTSTLTCTANVNFDGADQYEFEVDITQATKPTTISGAVDSRSSPSAFSLTRSADRATLTFTTSTLELDCKVVTLKIKGSRTGAGCGFGAFKTFGTYGAVCSCESSPWKLPRFSNFGVNDGERCTKTPNSVTCVAKIDTSSEYVNANGLKLSFWITGTSQGASIIEYVRTPFVPLAAATTPVEFVNTLTNTGGFTYTLAILELESSTTVTAIEYTIKAPTDMFCDAMIKNFVMGEKKTLASQTATELTCTNDWEFVNPVVGKKVGCPTDGDGGAGTDTTLRPTSPAPRMQNIFYKPAANPPVKDLTASGYPAVVSWDTAANLAYTVNIDAPVASVAGIDACPFTTDFAFGTPVTTSAGSLALNYLCPGYKYKVSVLACTTATPAVCAEEAAVEEFTPDVVPPTEATFNSAFTFGQFAYYPISESGTPVTGTYNRPTYDGGALISKYEVEIVLPEDLGDCPVRNGVAGLAVASGVAKATCLNSNPACSMSLSTKLCPGFSYTFKVKACNGENEATADRCSEFSASGASEASAVVPIVPPVCGIPPPYPAVAPQGFSTGPYGGSTVQDLDALQALETQLNNVLTTDPTIDLDYLNNLGFKTAVVFWPSVSYSGGQAPYEYNLTLNRYIKGINGYDNTKYQTFESGPFPTQGRFYAPTLANNVQPSHCYSMSVELCNSAGCCMPGHFNGLDLDLGTVSGTWFQPSQTYSRKGSAEPQDRLTCTNLKPWRGPDSSKAVGGVGVKMAWVNAGAAGAQAGAASAGASAGSSASGVAGVAAPAASAGTSNTLLAVAIAVPVGVAGLAIGAVAAAMIITRKQVRVATIAATSRAQALNGGINSSTQLMPPVSLTTINIRRRSVNAGSPAEQPVPEVEESASISRRNSLTAHRV